MANFESVEVSGIEQVNPYATGVDAPDVSTGITEHDVNASPSNGVGSFKRAQQVIGNRFIKKFGTAKAQDTADTFFGEVYILPLSIDAGFILATTTLGVTVYSSYLSGSVDWTAYDDSSAGEGVSLGNPLPPPPTKVLRPQTGVTHDLTIEAQGPPNINGFLAFTFLDPDAVVLLRSIPIRGQRSLLFPFRPEAPIVEGLQWVTRIRRAASGKEQRASLRESPRSTLNYNIEILDDERPQLENLTFDGQAKTFGVPIWFEESQLQADAPTGTTVLPVDSTAFARFAAGDVLAVWEASDNFETLQIDSVGPTSITLSSATTQDFSAGALILPVVNAVLVTNVSQRRNKVNTQKDAFAFVITNNGPDLSDISAFNTYTPAGGTERLLLDDPNLLESRAVREKFTQQIRVFDSGTAAPTVSTSQAVSREESSKGFYTNSREELDNLRKVLHYMAGRRRAFYLPTFGVDMRPFEAINPADQAVSVIDDDYVNLVAQRQPRNVIRIVKTDGTKSDPKLITGSTKPTPGQESISITPDTFGITATLGEIFRIEYIKKSRMNSDKVSITHFNSGGKSKTFVPVVTVLESD